MAKIPLFANWTWRLPLPKPFDTVAFSYSTSYWSKYCSTSTKKATLHASVLQAILSYMEMDTSLTPASTSENAIGTQGEKLIAEYQSRTDEIHVVVFNKKNGKFNVGRYEDISSTPRIYTLKDGSNTGSALFFALMPEALTDDEFQEYYGILGKCKNDGYSDMDKAEQAAYILCDNLYRRIEGADLLTDAGIRLSIPATGNLPQLTPLNLNKGAYSPNSVLFGAFRILTTPSAGSGTVVSINKNDFHNNFKFTDRTFTPREELLIPTLADWYIIPPEIVSICRHAQMTTNGNQPMRNFMLRGSAGTGKTEGAKAIARDTRGPIASIYYQGLMRIDQGIDVVEKSVVSYGGVQAGYLEKGCSWITLFIAMAPSLGFLGTVIGMVQAFDKIQQVGDISPTVVAGGMKVALITTIFGLIVALILQVFYNYILAKIEALTSEMEDSSISLLDMVIKYDLKYKK